MKQPPAFSTGEPSYLMTASTSGRVSPTALTRERVGPALSSPFVASTDRIIARTLRLNRSRQ